MQRFSFFIPFILCTTLSAFASNPAMEKIKNDPVNVNKLDNSSSQIKSQKSSLVKSDIQDDQCHSMGDAGWYFALGDTCSFKWKNRISYTGQVWRCTSFGDNHTNIILANFDITYEIGTKPPQITGTGCNVTEVSSGHIQVRNCQDMTFIACGSSMNATITNNTNGVIIGVCKADICPN
ncbi:hypothetical protein [Candidatus Tisiphia endosymbiont of Stenodema calcarata]|uniref:hypothetical protein n=1 Tax=Candidatus Tisiphia endosymbiont of Stenodema calcarata TaxID=3139337 RepID=UPI003CCAE599